MTAKIHKDALTSVLLGYSVANLNGTKVFIKHFGYTDSIESDYQYNLAFKEATKRGAPTEKERLAELKELELWDKQDDEIRFLKSAIENLKKRKKISAIPSEAKKFEEKIKENESKLLELNYERFRLVGTTAETVASQRAEDYYIYHSVFVDDKFTKSFFKEEFEEVDSPTFQIAKSAYYECLKGIVNGGVKHIALCDEFMNLMNLADNPYEILGKPLAFYSFFQSDLVSMGKFYKFILSNDPPPPTQHRYDPEKLEEWWDVMRNAQKLVKNTGQQKESIAGGDMIMGNATQEDLKQMFGEDSNIKNLDTEIKKNAKNGIVRSKDLLKIHGIG